MYRPANAALDQQDSPVTLLLPGASVDFERRVSVLRSAILLLCERLDLRVMDSDDGAPDCMFFEAGSQKSAEMVFSVEPGRNPKE
jgi:hypothetical protein